jgi:WD40 repeat protein
MDIKRHLENQPVIARPPTAAYRFQKAWRRNKAVFVAGITVILTIGIGGAASMWQAVVAWRARAQSEESSRLARANEQTANEQSKIAEAATLRAEQQETEMRRRAYAADMNLAHQAVRMGNLGKGLDLLNRYRPAAGQEELRGWEWRYLWGRCQSDALFTLCRLPQSNGVVSTAIRPGANWVALGGNQKGGVEVWDLSKRQWLAQLAPDEDFGHATFSPDGSRLAFSTVGWLRVWDCARRSVIAEIPMTNVVVSLVYSADSKTIITFQRGEFVTFWRASNLEYLSAHPVPRGHAGLGTPFAVTPDLKTAVVVNGLNGILVLELESGLERWRTNSPAGWTQAMAISADGTRLATSFGVADGTIQIWNLVTGEQLARLEGHRGWVSGLKFWREDRLISSSADQTIRVWDLNRRESIRILHGHRHEIWSLDFSADTSTLVSGGKDGEVLVWDLGRNPKMRGPRILSGPHWGWGFSADGRAIFAVERAPGSSPRSWRWAAEERAIHERNPGRVVRYQVPRFERTEILHEIPLSGDFIFSPTGRLFAASTTNGLLQVWDLNERTLAHEFSIGVSDFRPAAFSRDETRVWLLQTDEEQARRSVVAEWDLRTERPLRSIRGVANRYLTLQPDDWLVWDNSDGAANAFVFYDLRTGQVSYPGRLSARLVAPGNGPPSASPAGDLLVRTHEFGVLTVWETSSLSKGADAGPIKFLSGAGPMMNFSGSAFSPDGTRLLAGGHGAEAIMIWETQAYHEVLTLEGEGTHFHNIRFSADGTLLGALNFLGQIHLWNAATWAEIETRDREMKATLSESMR